MNSFVQNEIKESIRVKELLLKKEEDITRVGKTISYYLQKGGKIIVFGNGGSAADAQHFSSELMGKFRISRDPIPAIALTTNTSNLTSISNDFSYEDVFFRQLQGLLNPNDVVIGISTSGKSRNVLKAVKYAKKQGVVTIGLTGNKKPNYLTKLADYNVIVPSTDTQRIQEAHLLLIHLMCGLIETSLRKHKGLQKSKKKRSHV